MSVLAATASGIVYGALHGVGPDHCAALASLLARDTEGKMAVRISLRFGLAHAFALGGFATIAVGAGWLIPSSWEVAAEIAGGVLLILLGVLALRRTALELLVHRHRHPHGESSHEHWHTHVGQGAKQHRHVHLATAVGGTFALSGVRALALALPPLLVAGESLWTAGMFVVAFGLGVTGAMTILGVAFRALLRSGKTENRPHVARWLSTAIGCSSAALGVWWIWSSLG